MAVQFRRVHGHVIPIRDKNELPKAAALATAGVGAGVAAGKVSAILHREAAHYSNRSFFIQEKIKEYAGYTKKNLHKEAAQNRLEGIRLHTAGKRIQTLGAAAGTALVAAGVSKALDQTSLKDKPGTKGAIVSGSAVATHFAIRSSYLTSFTHKNATKGAIGGTFNTLKHAAKRLAARGLKL